MQKLLILFFTSSFLFAAQAPLKSAYFIFDNKIDLSFEISPVSEKLKNKDYQKEWETKAKESFVFEKNNCKSIKAESDFIKEGNSEALLLNISFVCHKKLSKTKMRILQKGLLKDFSSFEFATVNDDGVMKVQTIKNRDVRLF